MSNFVDHSYVIDLNYFFDKRIQMIKKMMLFIAQELE
jgi:hypothetical protein